MIQRVQTIWLLLAAAAGFGATQVPVYKGTYNTDTKYFYAPEDFLLFAIISLAGLLAIVAIFLFKNRKSQIKWAMLGLLISLCSVASIVWRIDAVKEKNIGLTLSFYWGALLPIAMFLFFMLAVSNIRKDEKLIKSLDRLR